MTDREERRKEEIGQMETNELVRLIFRSLFREDFGFDLFWAEAELNRRLPARPARAGEQIEEGERK